MWTRNGITKGGERHRTGMRTYCSVSQRQKEKQLRQTVTTNHGRQVLLGGKISFWEKKNDQLEIFVNLSCIHNIKSYHEERKNKNKK